MGVEAVQFEDNTVEIAVADGYKDKYPEIENLESFLEPEINELATEYNVPEEIIPVLKQAFFDIVELISTTRNVLGLTPFNLDHFTMLARGLYRTASLHREENDPTKARKRKDGTYYVEHLIETAKNMIQEEALTSLFSVLPAIEHDDEEDVKDVNSPCGRDRRASTSKK